MQRRMGCCAGPLGWAGIRALFIWSVRLLAVAGQYAGFDPVGAHASQYSLRGVLCSPLSRLLNLRMALQGAVSLEVHQMGTSRSGYNTFQVAVSFDP